MGYRSISTEPRVDVFQIIFWHFLGSAALKVPVPLSTEPRSWRLFFFRNQDWVSDHVAGLFGLCSIKVPVLLSTEPRAGGCFQIIF
jgi:hypothetical protein